MNRSLRIALAAVVVLASTGAAQAGSIWKRGTRRMRVIATDDTAQQIGDVITIAISEHSIIENETSRTMGKATSRKGATTGTLDLANLISRTVGQHIFDFPMLNMDLTSDQTFSGTADFESDRSVEDRVTVTVEDVLPNGNLVIFGKRQRQVEGDTQVIQVSGIVRPSDLSFDNTVDSDRVANFRLVYKSTGRESRMTKPGWLGRFLNWINPF